MILRDEKELNGLRFIGTFYSGYYDDVVGFDVSENEDFSVEDITLHIEDGTERAVECKTYNGYLKIHGQWNGRWNSSTSGNILTKMAYFDDDSTGWTIDEIYENGYKNLGGEWKKGLPLTMSGHCTFVINAEADDGNTTHCKYWKVMDKHATFTILARDGLVMFTPEQLRAATFGTAWMYCRHTERFGGSWKYERKMLVDITRGTYIPLKAPITLF